MYVRGFCWKMGNTSTYTLISRQWIQVRVTLTTAWRFTCTTISCPGRVTCAARGSGKREMGFIDELGLTHWGYVFHARTHRYIVRLWILNNTKPFLFVSNDTPSQVDIIVSSRTAYHCLIMPQDNMPLLGNTWCSMRQYVPVKQDMCLYLLSGYKNFVPLSKPQNWVLSLWYSSDIGQVPQQRCNSKTHIMSLLRFPEIWGNINKKVVFLILLRQPKSFSSEFHSGLTNIIWTEIIAWAYNNRLDKIKCYRFGCISLRRGKSISVWEWCDNPN